MDKIKEANLPAKLNASLRQASELWYKQPAEFRAENPLYAFLNFSSEEEYASWIRDPSCIQDIVSKRVLEKMAREGN